MTLNYDDLLGVPYVEGKDDCFELMRKFYSANYNINMPPYARPSLWWAKAPELDLLRKNLADNGFVPFDRTPRNLLPGDALLMQIGSSVLDHCGAYLGSGRFLHHPFRGKSEVALLAGLWGDRVMITARHKDIVHTDDRPTLDLMELLPAQKRERYRAILAQYGK